MARVQMPEGDELFEQGEPAFLGTRQGRCGICYIVYILGQLSFILKIDTLQ
jgi:hypothetical protein